MRSQRSKFVSFLPLFYLVLLLQVVGVVEAGTLTSLVNLFIGTETVANGGSGGNAFPGAAVPHAMAKVRSSKSASS